MVDISGGLSKYSVIMGMSAGVTYSVTHSLNTSSILVDTWDDDTGEQIIVNVVRTSDNSIDVNSVSSLSNVRFVVIG